MIQKHFPPLTQLTSSHLTDRVDCLEGSDRSYTWSTKECSHLLLTRQVIYIVRMSTRRISTRVGVDDALRFPVVDTKDVIISLCAAIVSAFICEFHIHVTCSV